MPEFKWKATTRAGREQTGTMEAENADQVRAALQKQQFTVTSVKKKAKELTIAIPGLTGRVSDKDLVIFTRTFSTMVDAGLPLVQCLEILSEQTENAILAKAIRAIRSDVESGSTYADALRKHPKVFDALYCNMVEAGEVGGILDTVLNRLAAYMEKAMSLKRQVKSALVYPSVVISVAVGVVTFLMIFVIPVFGKIFQQLGSTLPLPTKIVMGLSAFMKSYILLMIAGFVGLILFIRYVHKTHRGARILDGFMLKFPVIGMLLRKVAVAKFTRTLSTLISSGVPILDGLEITARTAGNTIIEDAVMATRTAISEGKTIADPLAETDVFPPMVIQMISVGESTGALDSMLAKIADFYDEEVDVAVANLTQMLEPLLMIFLGVTVGGIVVAMYMPMFKLIGELSK
ncbi:MAG: pilus assembly protein PilC [Candidatus Schekmanbacteria bacterium RBG_13_48_7]|uniref:Pilus assembly protein PilC n=1 Tax=Candidatus Schekmanbacteria bacterium RBG_13_48_7 TaxID=1817878 RepID=A0A1F7RQ53_9BACT|nr:MAG: pilus assembly protein PilC [Candidatus Schekmanbacteria bacterium RBG_13_48_7]